MPGKEQQWHITFSEHLSAGVIDIVPRPLRHQEMALLRFLLAASGQDFTGQQELQAQVSHTRVLAELDNGNPTIYLEVDRHQCSPAHVTGRIPDEGHWSGGDGHPCEVLVHVIDGYLAELELHCYGDEPLRTTPNLEQLTIHVDLLDHIKRCIYVE